MFREILVLVFTVYCVNSAVGLRWIDLGPDIVCTRPKGNGYGEVTYKGNVAFIRGVKLEHYYGTVGCCRNCRSNWGCRAGKKWLAMIVTDEENSVMYPSTAIISKPGWYQVSKFTSSSSSLALVDLKSPGKKLIRGAKLRIWYGPDLKKYKTNPYREGITCYRVYVLV